MPLATPFLAVFLATTVPASASNTPAGVEEAVRLFKTHQFAEVRRLLEPLAARDKSGEAAFWLGRVALREQDFDRAVSWMEKAVAANPTHSGYQQWLGRALGQKALRAGVLKQAFLAKKVRDRYLEAVRLDPDNLDARYDLEEFYLVAPGVMGGSLQKAEEQAREIARRDPMRGLRAAARVHEQKKEAAEAERKYRQAVEQYPGKSEPFFWLANHYQRRKDSGRAIETLEQLLRADPSAVGAYYGIARIALASGERLERAEECLKLYLKTEPGKDDPPLAWAHFRLGSVYEKKGDRAAAKAEYEAALRLDPALKDAKEALKRPS